MVLSIELYKEFTGSNIEQMPKLIAEGRVPMSFSELMEIVLKHRDAPETTKKYWLDTIFDTGDAILYSGDRMKIVFDSQHLREIAPTSVLYKGALVLPEGAYEETEGSEFILKDITKYLERKFTKEQAKTNPIWREVAKDQHLLNDYVDFIFSEGIKREKSGKYLGRYNDKFLDIYLAFELDERDLFESSIETEILSLRSLGCSPHLLGSAINGRNELNYWAGCLIGIEPKN